MYTDTHVHFDAFRDPGELAGVLARARAAGVTRMIAVGSNDDSNAFALSVAAQNPGLVRAVIGYDRDEATKGYSATRFAGHLGRPGVVGIGEIGLDYHYHPETAGPQKRLFGEMLAVARERRLPVVVHSRQADEDILALLTAHAARWPGRPDAWGVLHCFTGSSGFAERLLAIGMMISFSGVITFRNAEDLRDVAARVPEDRLLIETDTPYLAPVPHRGQPNEPAYVADIAEALAKIRNDSPGHIAHSTSRNAERLFGLNQGGTS